MCEKINRNSLGITMLYRLPLYHKNFPLVLFWSQKSACTSLTKWFFFQLGLLDQALQYNSWVHYYREEVYQRQKDYQANLIHGLLQGKATIKLVRNPYQRVVSSFLGLARMSFFTKGTRKQEWQEIKKYLYNIKKYSDEGFEESISFKQYLYYLQGKGTKVSLINAHRAQQYIYDEETYVSDYLYLEDFRESIYNIEQEYGLLDSPQSIFESQHHRSHLMKEEGDWAEKLITEETFSREYLPTYDSFYDQETIELVNELFAEDFAVYGYQKK